MHRRRLRDLHTVALLTKLLCTTLGNESTERLNSEKAYHHLLFAQDFSVFVLK